MSFTVGVLSVASEHTTARYFERAICKTHPLRAVSGESFSSLQTLLPEDLLFFVDPTTDWPLGLERLPCRKAAYLIDVHQDLDSRLRLSMFFDTVFIAQKDYLTAFQDAGHPNVEWLPLACEPELHAAQHPMRTFDVSFVGNMGARGTKRFEVLSEIFTRYPQSTRSGFLSPRLMAAVYGQSKIVVNASINGDLNMRVFEAMASGALLVTDRISNGMADLFKEGTHYVGYSVPSEALDLIDHYLKNPAERERIAACGQQAALAHHTYDHRWQRVVGRIIDSPRDAPARRASPTVLGKLYSEIFRTLRRPERAVEVLLRYGFSDAVLLNLIRTCAAWINARVPFTPNALKFRWRHRGRST